MSDYLTRLAARALGQAEVVQPRLPSLFEAEPAALEERVVRDAPLADAEPGGLPREPRAHRPSREAERPEVSTRGAAEDPPTVDAASRGTRKPAAQATSRSPATGKPGDDVEPAARGLRAARRETSESRPREAEPPDARQQAAAEHERQAAARARRSPEAIPLTTRSRPAVVVERSAHGDAPSVRVTIGRVEVRAIAPPPSRPAQAQPRPPAPRLSLDEYVRLRDEGKR